MLVKIGGGGGCKYSNYLYNPSEQYCIDKKKPCHKTTLIHFVSSLLTSSHEVSLVIHQWTLRSLQKQILEIIISTLLFLPLQTTTCCARSSNYCFLSLFQAFSFQLLHKDQRMLSAPIPRSCTGGQWIWQSRVNIKVPLLTFELLVGQSLWISFSSTIWV